MGDLTKDFSRKEFACPCCGRDDIDPYLVRVLQYIRNEIGVSIQISSGVRCEKHNAEIPGSAQNSSHIIGKAADIRCVDMFMRYKLLKAIFPRFRRVEIRDTWIHVDVDPIKSQDVCF